MLHNAIQVIVALALAVFWYVLFGYLSSCGYLPEPDPIGYQDNINVRWIFSVAIWAISAYLISFKVEDWFDK
ncbi:hypothetical protein KKG31_09055 [Patescibacteria group bacterium]|nr:hypothetical protein [Patescibacteria group bacterium]MBU1759200.1 hypothetical protein [Patescibacteria group bacterium]